MQKVLISLIQDLSSESIPFLLLYSLRYNYSHAQGNTTARSSSKSINLSFLSSTLSYTQSITPHRFANSEAVETNISTCLTINRQCGQPYTGAEICCSFSTSKLPKPIH